MAKAELYGQPVDVELLPRSLYEATYTANAGIIGFAFETQGGTHALGSDRRVPFYNSPHTLAYVPAGCDVYSRSIAGGEYLHIRAGAWSPPGARQVNGLLIPKAIAAARIIRSALLGRRSQEPALQDALDELSEALAAALAPQGDDGTSRCLIGRRIRIIDEVIEARSHAPPTAGRAEAALLAAEGDQLLGVTGLAVQAQETFLQPTALQAGLELLLHVPRQRPACFGSKLPECRIVLLHQLVEQRDLGPVPGIVRRIEKRRRTGGVELERRPCDGRGRNRLWQRESERPWRIHRVPAEMPGTRKPA